MEIPDSNGYVNLTWPSKNVPHGGVFHTRVEEISHTQQKFLELLLDESRLTTEQRRKSAYKLRDSEPKQAPVVREHVRNFRPRTSCRRSLSAIRASGIFEADSYRPLKKGEDREKLKESLAHVMAYGDKVQQTPRPPRPAKLPPKLPTNKEKWNDLVTQIRERADWLAEMEVLGEADAHREVIQDQIAERMRALDALGVDSVCSSVRSKGSGFSVLDTDRRSMRSGNSLQKTGGTARSTLSLAKNPQTKGRNKKESAENVQDYRRNSPLQYTPRRRV